MAVESVTVCMMVTQSSGANQALGDDGTDVGGSVTIVPSRFHTGIKCSTIF